MKEWLVEAAEYLDIRDGESLEVHQPGILVTVWSPERRRLIEIVSWADLESASANPILPAIDKLRNKEHNT